jgi:hypothetical protein
MALRCTLESICCREEKRSDSQCKSGDQISRIPDSQSVVSSIEPKGAEVKLYDQTQASLSFRLFMANISLSCKVDTLLDAHPDIVISMNK